MARWSACVDKRFADAEGAHTRATILGRDVAPGDQIAIRIATLGQIKMVIQEGHDGRIGRHAGGRGGRIGYSIVREDHDVGRGDGVPADAPVDAWLPITVSMDLETHAYSSFETGDAVTLEVFVRSEHGRTMRIALDVALAVLAWLAAAALCYAIARWRPASAIAVRQAEGPMDAYTTRLVANGALLGVAAIGMIGDLVFVRTLHRITSSDSLAVELALLGAWLAALALGVVLGLRARRAELRWWKARLRPVIGTPPMTEAFRGAGSVLPPSLSREVDAKPLAEVLATLAAAGFTHEKRVISRDGAPVARIATKLATVRPEQLALDVFEGYDARPLARALTGLFGPLEISSRFTPPSIIDPQ